MSGRDERFMRRALALAARAGRRTVPNPLVGAVVARGARVVGEGWHQEFGGPHAEVHALEAAGPRAKGATLYVTLEPCMPFAKKKTPPCVDAVIRSGVRRVVVALRDPNPRVDGRGIERLRKAGIRVDVGLLEAEAAEQNASFLKVATRGLPWIALKWAMTLDGRLAARTGDARWISNDASRAWARRWRDGFDAILVGVGTVLQDDPRLTGAEALPARIVLDSTARTPLDSKLVRTAKRQRTLIVVSSRAPDSRLARLRKAGVRILRSNPRRLPALFRALAALGLHRILVEGGATVHASMIAAGLADEVCVYVAPKIVGARPRMSQARRLREPELLKFGSDVMIWGRL